MGELRVLMNGAFIGAVQEGPSGELRFAYERAWQESKEAVPLSLSMPLARRAHGDDVVRPFMEGLLPDNSHVLDQWARRFQVSARNPFALLTHMGEDCAGAVQFVRPDRPQHMASLGEGEVEWLVEEEVAERLRELVERHGTGRFARDRGQFSLAGAQPKMPLLYDGERWGIPYGQTPTTHILKPPAQEGLSGFDVNEHLCLGVARELGLSAARSTVRRFADQVALVVERYDRGRLPDGRLVRLHQEDACQALAVSPLRKYQNEGGPGPVEIVELLLRESDDPETDIGAFLDALALNWVIGGTDAHAKNYALLLSPASVRLAPLYDLICVLPYPRLVPYRKAKLAMKIHSEYQLWKIRRRHWEGLAARCDLDAEPVVIRVGEVVSALPEACDKAAVVVRAEGIDHEIVGEIERQVRKSADQCLRALGA